MQIHCLVITHKFGTNISAHSNGELALDNLYEYVKEFRSDVWRNDDNDLEFNSLSREEAIEFYFENHEEYYYLEVLSVEMSGE